MDTPSPANDSPQVVHFSQAGVTGGASCSATAATGAVRARCAWPAGRAWPLPRPGAGPRWLAALPLAGRGARLGAPAPGALFPRLGPAAARARGRAGLARGHQSPLCTAVTADVEQTSDGWLFVIRQMAPVM